MIGPIGLIGKGIANISLLSFKWGWIVLTLIVLSSVMVGSINEGIEKEDWSIPFKTFGTTILSADEVIYDEVQKLEEENLKFDFKENVFESFKELLGISWHVLKNIFVGLWMIIFNFILFYKFFIFLIGDSSKFRKALTYSFFTMVGLQILVSGIPFKGVYSLIKLVFSIVLG